jgi:hypothetical protein
MAADAIDALRKKILDSEERIAYFERQLKERPNYTALWLYWLTWYQVNRIDTYTQMYLAQVQRYKALLQRWEQEGTTDQHLKDADVIAKNVGTIEDGLAILDLEIGASRKIASERDWHIRYPKPYTTMVDWIDDIKKRYPIIAEWIAKIRDELPQAWIDFVYVIYYEYSSRETQRHLEAHLESKCINKEQVKVKVKEMANKVLLAFIAAPRVANGGYKPGYAQPMLRREMADAPYQGQIPYDSRLSAKENQDLWVGATEKWRWGIEFMKAINYNLEEGRIINSEQPAPKPGKEVAMRLEIFDYDYHSYRSYREANVPARWWTTTLDELLKILGIKRRR